MTYDAYLEAIIDHKDINITNPTQLNSIMATRGFRNFLKNYDLMDSIRPTVNAEYSELGDIKIGTVLKLPSKADDKVLHIIDGIRSSGEIGANDTIFIKLDGLWLMLGTTIAHQDDNIIARTKGINLGLLKIDSKKIQEMFYVSMNSFQGFIRTLVNDQRKKEGYRNEAQLKDIDDLI